MGDYMNFDFTADIHQLVFQGKVPRDIFNDLTFFPGCDKMKDGQLYKWIVPNTAICKTGEHQGAHVLKCFDVEQI